MYTCYKCNGTGIVYSHTKGCNIERGMSCNCYKRNMTYCSCISGFSARMDSIKLTKAEWEKRMHKLNKIIKDENVKKISTDKKGWLNIQYKDGTLFKCRGLLVEDNGIYSMERVEK